MEEVSNVMEVDYEEEEDESDDEYDEKNFSYKLDFPMVGDLFEMCTSLCGCRKLSVLIYTILCHFGVNTWRQIDDILRSIGV